jgi:ribonuclease HI
MPSHDKEAHDMWGIYPKHSMTASIAYPDGSADKGSTKAGFGVYFPDLDANNAFKTMSTRIPGHQTIARAEGFGILAALLLVRQDSDLTIHCDRKPLVDQINKLLITNRKPHILRKLKDQSLLLRILDEVTKRSARTTIVHVKAHMRDIRSQCSAQNQVALNEREQHQEHNKVVDKLAKDSIKGNNESPSIPDEVQHLPDVTITLDKHRDGKPGPIYENNPLKLY